MQACNDILYCSEQMKKNHKEQMSIDYEIKRDLKIETVANGIIHPLEIPQNGANEVENYGGVTDEKLNLIDLSLVKRDKGFNPQEYPMWYVGANQKNDFDNIPYIDEDVIFLGPIHTCISHFYLECFSRFWILLEEQYKNYKVVLLPMPDGEIYDFHKEFFELIGLKQEQILFVNKPIKCKNVIIPEQSCSLNKSYHKKYKELFDKMAENIEPLNYKKVYFSKTSNLGRVLKTLNNEYVEKVYNSKQIDELYRKNGYKVVYPEKLSVKETISILKNCDELVAQSGSNAHNAIFMKEGAKLTILNRSEHFHPIQMMINNLRKLQVTYVDTFYDKLPHSWSSGPYIFLFTEYFKKYLEDNKFKYNQKEMEKESKAELKSFLKTYPYYYLECYPSELLDREMEFSQVFDLLKSLDLLYNDKSKKIIKVTRPQINRICYNVLGFNIKLKKK